MDARNGNGRTPAVIALFGLHRWWRNGEKPGILELLLKSGAEYTLLIAATRGDETRVREILSSRSFTRQRCRSVLAAPAFGSGFEGHTHIVRLLLEHGADPNAKEAVCQGGYSLHEAASDGRLKSLSNCCSKEEPSRNTGSILPAIPFSRRNAIPNSSSALPYGGTMELQVYAASHRIDVIAEVLKLQPSRATMFYPTAGTTTAAKTRAPNHATGDSLRREV